MSKKPFRGKFRDWHRHYYDGENYYMLGVFDGHPEFDGEWGNTSQVLSEKKTDNEDVIEIETRNSHYLCIGPEKKV